MEYKKAAVGFKEDFIAGLSLYAKPVTTLLGDIDGTGRIDRDQLILSSLMVACVGASRGICLRWPSGNTPNRKRKGWSRG